MNKNTRKINKKCFKLSDQIFFSQRLALLLNSGVSIIEALSMMKNMDKSVQRKMVYDTFIEDIEKGISLSKSIKKIGLRFKDILFVLIQNGENGGNLSEALIQGHDYLEKKNEMNKKIINSLIYPAFIVLATIGMTLFLILYIFPKIIPLLTSLDIKPPLVTRIVQSLYYFLISYGLWFGLGIVLMVFLFRFIIKKSEYIKYRIDLLILSTPFINNYIKIHTMSSICGIGEMLLASGKGLPDVLFFSKESSKNVVYKKVFSEMHEESVKGVSLSISLYKNKKFFPSLLPDMCSLGERTGSLGTMLKHCSRIFEQDIDDSLKRFSSLIEPCLMVFMGLIVGSIALSIILPVYEITNHLSK